MNFDLEKLEEYEKEKIYEIAGEISCAALMMDFDRVSILMDSIKYIYENRRIKMENSAARNEEVNFKKLIKADENGNKYLELPKHRGLLYWPIFRSEILKKTEKAFGILNLEATPEEISYSAVKYKSKPICWIPKSKIITYDGIYFAHI